MARNALTPRQQRINAIKRIKYIMTKYRITIEDIRNYWWKI